MRDENNRLEIIMRDAATACTKYWIIECVDTNLTLIDCSFKNRE